MSLKRRAGARAPLATAPSYVACVTASVGSAGLTLGFAENHWNRVQSTHAQACNEFGEPV